MQALWGEPWTARSVSVDGNEVVSFRGDVTDLWLLALANHSEGKARSREDEMSVPPRVLSGSSVSTLLIRFLALVVFSVLSCTFFFLCKAAGTKQSDSKLNQKFLSCFSSSSYDGWRLSPFGWGFGTRGSGNSLRPFRPSSRPGTLSFSNRAPLLWNNLPPSIQQAPSTPSFKSNYLKYLLCSPNAAQHLELALGNPLC